MAVVAPSDRVARWPIPILAAAIVVYLSVPWLLGISTPTPIVDEPIFAYSAFEYARSGEVHLSELSAPNGVFDAVWGGWFARVLGETLGSLRFSTLVLTAISAGFLYWLCRQLGARPGAASLATIGYLVCPLAFSLSYTTMTDARAVALSVIAVALIARALSDETRAAVWMIGGSAVISMAFLSRQQALVVALVALLVLFASGKPRVEQATLALALVLPVLATYLLHEAWVSEVGEPYLRTASRNLTVSRGLSRVPELTSQAVLQSIIYIGLFVLPLVFLLAPGVDLVRERIRTTRWVGPLALGLLAFWTVITVAGIDPMANQTWFHSAGLGAVEASHFGSRPALMPNWMWSGLTLGMVAGTWLFVCGSEFSTASVPRDQRRLVIWSAVGFAAATMPSAILNRTIHDRYWLPVLPLVLAAVAPYFTLSRLRTGFAAGAITVVAVFSALGTVDAFSAYRASVGLADSVVSAGHDRFQLDGGASWSAMQFGLISEDLDRIFTNEGPFWFRFYAVDSQPTKGIALSALGGFDVLEVRPYRSLLHIAQTNVVVIEPQPGVDYFTGD